MSGVYYGRLKVEGKSNRKSFRTGSFPVARAALRDWLAEFKLPEAKGGSTLGSVVELYQGWLSGEVLKGSITQSTLDYKLELGRRS